MREATVDTGLDRLISRRASQDTRPDPGELDKQEAQAETFVHDPGPDSLRYGPPAA